MIRHVRPALTLLIVLTILTGILYPVAVTAIAQVAFPDQANGSLIERGDEIVGSKLLGQPFSKPEYFWGRLSATQPFPYNAAASSGSNYGPMHPALKTAAKARIESLQTDNRDGDKVPVDLVTSSASGLDPHISPAAAELQVARVAAARKMEEDAVRRLVHRHTEGRQWGVFGEPRVNVLELNLALDQQHVSE